MIVRKMISCSDPKNPECSNYIDTDADPTSTEQKHELSRDYRGKHRSKFTAKKTTEIYDFVGDFDGKKAYDVVMKAVKSAPVNIRSAPTQATTDVIPPEAKAKALLSESAYLKDPVKAQEFLDNNGADFEVLPEYTTDFMTTAIDAEGKVVVAFRGTEPTSIADVYNDIRIIQGAKRHFKTERNALDKIVEEFGKENVELTGHSLGGNKAIELGKQIGLDTETFNPLIGRDSLSRGHPNTTNTVWGTTDDVASQLAGLGDFEVNRVRPLKSSLNPIKGHEMKNFYETGERRADFREAILDEVHNAGKKFGELELVNDMKETRLAFKDFMADHSPRDVLAEGGFSNRVNKGSRMVQIWEELGKPFTYQENLDIASKPTPITRSRNFTTTEERMNVSNETVEEARNDMMKQMERANGENEVHAKISDTLIDAVHPVALAKGTIASLAGAGVVELADPEHKLNEDVHQGLAGATGGVFTELAIAGTAVTAGSIATGAIAGAGGVVAGYETQKVVEKAMLNAGINEDATGSLSSMTGGAVAGATTAVGAIAGGALMGAEMGVYGGVVGVAVGTGIGTLAGLAGWGIGKLFHNDEHSPSAEEIAEKQRQEETTRLLAERAKHREEVKERREAYWAEHPHEKAQLEAELRAKEDAQEIDTRPQRTFKGRRAGGTHLGTYDTRKETGVKPISLTDTSVPQSA
tara:strand:- start:23 stop:2107 length:2085 start_codon:yes stop_codon:yes gene_type:complete